MKEFCITDHNDLTIQITNDNGAVITLTPSECRDLYDLINREYCREDILKAIDDKIQNGEISEKILEEDVLIDDLTDCYIESMEEGTTSREGAIDDAFFECRYEVKEYEDMVNEDYERDDE